MATLSDKEVGELWAWYVSGKLPQIEGFSLTTDYTKALIRKLLDERAYLIYQMQYEPEHAYPDVEKVVEDQACREFGIDPDEVNHD